MPKCFKGYLSCNLLKHKAAAFLTTQSLYVCMCVCVCVCIGVFCMILATKAAVSLTHCVAAAALSVTHELMFLMFLR